MGSKIGLMGCYIQSRVETIQKFKKVIFDFPCGSTQCAGRLSFGALTNCHEEIKAKQTFLFE